VEARVDEALDRVVAMTLGTATRCGPFETVSATVEPFFTAVPAAGRCAVTCPAGADAKTTRWFDPRPAAWSRFTAVATGCPTTFGTPSFGFPAEIVSATVPPCESRAPPSGACATTIPFRLELGVKRTWALKPACVTRLAAIAFGRLTTLGTVRVATTVTVRFLW